MGGLLLSTPGTSGPAYSDARTTRDVYDAHAFERRAAPFRWSDSPYLPSGRLRAGDLEFERPRAKTGSCVSVAVGCGERARSLRALACPGRAAESSQSGSEVQVRRDVDDPFGGDGVAGVSVGARQGRPRLAPAEQWGTPGRSRVTKLHQVVLAAQMADERTDTVKTADA